MRILEIRKLSCGYGKKTVLHNINFSVQEGEIIGIIGPNGSGKTTLLRAITRLIKPKKGSVLLKGKDIWSIKIKEFVKTIAIVPQYFNGGEMSVEEFVLLGRIPHFNRYQFLETKKDLDTAKRCMDLTDTLRLKDHLVEEISGGEKQLTLIARGLTQEPKILLLDEPTTHLDITHQIQILDLIKRLNKKFGITVIMILHDLNLASEYCGRLVLINKGSVCRIGQPKNVMDYRVIEEVYNTVVLINKNPVSGKPYVLIVPEEERKKERDEKRID